MFDINAEVEKYTLFQTTKTKGYKLPYKHTDKGKQISNADKRTFTEQMEIDAEREAEAMTRGYKNKSTDFGLRLKKSHGETHH